MKTTGVLACLAIVITAGWLLFTGSELLDVELPFAFPAGNIAAAVMLAVPVVLGWAMVAALLRGKGKPA